MTGSGVLDVTTSLPCNDLIDQDVSDICGVNLRVILFFNYESVKIYASIEYLRVAVQVVGILRVEDFVQQLPTSALLSFVSVRLVQLQRCLLLYVIINICIKIIDENYLFTFI